MAPEHQTIGYNRDGDPIYRVGGAAPDDELDDEGPDDDPDGLDDDPDDEGPDDDPNDPDDGEPGPWQPPDQAEWERVRGALEKANGEAKKHRLKARELIRQQEEQRRLAAAAAAAAEGRTEEYERTLAAAALAEQTYKPVAIRAAAKAALLEAGLRLDPSNTEKANARLKRVIRMLDTDDIELDEDGEVVGLDTQVAEIKDTYPELFGPLIQEPVQPVRPRVRRIDAAERVDQEPPPVPRTTGEKIAAQVLGPDW